MKILNILLYIAIILILLVAGYVFYMTGQQEKFVGYTNFISESSSEISLKINEQSDQINGIDSFSKINEEEIVELEKLSEDLEQRIEQKREDAKKFENIEGKENADAKFEEFLSAAEEVNAKYIELLKSIKELEEAEVVLANVKAYNDAITELSGKINELSSEIENLKGKDQLFF